MIARRKKRLFLHSPWLLLRQRHLHVGAAVAFAVTLLFLALVLLSTSPSSPPPSRDNRSVSIRRSSSSSPPSADSCGAVTRSLGEFGDMMVSMLPKNLTFTVFGPSPESFRRVLRLRPNDSVAEGKADATYAVVSRVLGFSTVPRRLRAADVPLRRRPQQMAPVLESVSGLRISAWRRDDADGALVVNGVPSEWVNIVKDQAIIVHVMAGVLMNAEFFLFRI